MQTNVFPSDEQGLLIRAAVGEGETARRAWAAWRSGRQLDEVDGASYELLPAVYRNLVALGVDDPWLERLKELYRYHWSDNQVRAHAVAGVVRALEERDVATLVLKGAALGPLHYGDAGARPMGDVDLLVPRADAHRAMAIVRSAGYAPATDYRPEERVGIRHAAPFAGPDGHVVDLHWYALWQPSDDGELWAGAVPFELGGVPTRALNPTDQLLHVCLHGLRWSPSPPIRWVADALAVVRGRAVDWDRLVAAAAARRATVVMATALRHLVERFEADVPAAALARMRGHRVSWLERAAFAADLRQPPHARRAAVLLDRHRRLRALGEPVAAGGFVRFVARSWQVDSVRELALGTLRRHAAARLRRAPRRS